MCVRWLVSRQTLKANLWDAQEGHMCPHHTTCVSLECKPLVVPIPTMTQSVLQTSPAEVVHTFPLCVSMHPNSVSISVHQEVMNHEQCQQSTHTF